MIGEVAADLCLPKLMSIIVDCGITGGVDIADSKLGSTVMRIVFGEGSYTSMQIIITFGILMLLIVLVGGFFGVMCAYTAAKASQSLGHDLRCDAYEKVMSLSIEQTDKFTTGSLVTRMTNDISMIINFVEMFLRILVRSPMFFVGGLVMLLSLNISFSLVLLCALPVLVIMLIFVLGKAIPIYSKLQTKLDRLNCVVQENVTGARVIKAYVKEEYEGDRFDKANADLRDTNIRVQRIMAIMHPVLMIVMNAAIIAVIYIGGWQIDNVAGTGMTAGTVMAAITYITQVIMSIMMMTHMFQSVSRAMASVKRVNEILDTDPVIVSGSVTEADSDIAVSFENVSFKYPGSIGKPILSDVSFKVRRGETFAIIGATGSGKTSLVRLIPRFYDATEGEIRIDGVPVKELDLDYLRHKISYVMQKSELFSGTVAENIRWGKEDATDDEVIEAARVAQTEQFILGLNDGYNDMIAEKGASLSGGQKQRMSIARAIVRKPEILILDDATSALDLSTEAKLTSALREKMSGTTVIMIAQRIASVKNADRIAVIENGTIKDCAPHDVLMQTSETYRDIYNSQMKNGGEQA
ncbi:MAG: ABC transporter ATP-binding protein [Clostridia bacterium]|nr:ABC transporter ATP-binding protein [Clostridia bacterium]